jgi:branched-chain amino acid transport system ATP-binding protein
LYLSKVNMVAGTKTGNQAKIEIKNLSLSFKGVKALSDVSLDIRDNEILAIIGPNGAGKTCLLNCINGWNIL